MSYQQPPYNPGPPHYDPNRPINPGQYPAYGAPPPRQGSSTTSKVLLGCAISAFLVGFFFVFGLVGFLVYVGATGVPPEVVAYSSLPQKHKDTVEKIYPLDDGEEILQFYSVGFLSAEDDFILLTNMYLVLHSREEFGAMPVYFPLEYIRDVRVVKGTGLLDDSMVYVYLEDEEDEDHYYFSLSTTDGGDDRFIAEMKRLIKELRIKYGMGPAGV